MKRQHIDEIKAIIVLSIGMILLASLLSFVPEDLPWYTSHPNDPAKNLIRIVGAYTAGALLFTFGYSAFFVVLFLVFWSWNKFSSRTLSLSFSKLISFGVLFCTLSAFFSMTGQQELPARFGRSGMVGLLFSDFLVQYLGRTGSTIILFTLGTLTLILIGEFLVSPVLLKSIEKLKELFLLLKRKFIEHQQRVFTVRSHPQKNKFSNKFSNELSNEPSKEERIRQLLKKPIKSSEESDEENQQEKKSPETNKKEEDKEESAKKVVKPQIRITPTESQKPQEAVPVKIEKPIMLGEYHIPPLDLLDDLPLVSSKKLQDDLVIGARVLEETLADFGVVVRVADIERGPVITRYELEPAPGVKVQRITTLSDDIALAMRAQTVRIVAPIPGKNRVGVEVPNGASSAVYLKDVLTQSRFRSSGSKLMLALGKDISGKPLIADLAEMPHLLIAGTTGSGKTVCVNSIIMSMLFNASPDEVKFLMVDPKMVELTPYNAIPHALCPAVTDPKKVSAALNWVVGEMESRYSQLAKAGVRNIKGYHEKGHKLPFIVIIIDELADLMQVSAKTIESAITRLAQLSRAVGIHLILATQRPSVDVITGVIKANFPARISFKVASKVDSRTVLDMNGAENLLGKGDLLFMKPGDAKPNRGQCSYVSDNEIQKVIDFIKTQQNPIYDDSILKQQTTSSAGVEGEKDELYDEAVRLIIETNQASVSILQRRMRLGYTRAARLIDLMEQNGIVGPYSGSKPRDLLVDREEWLLQNMNKKENG